MSGVAFIDTETLGLDPDHHPIWEVGLILPDGGEFCWQIEVTGRELGLAHPKALEIGRFDERYDKTAEAEPSAVVAGKLSLLIPQGCHLAGAVVSFDEERLRRLFWRHGLVPPWHYHLIDVEALAAGWLAAAVEDVAPTVCRPPWKSDELSRAVGVDPDRFDRHTALGDARWAKAIYDVVYGPS